MKAGFAKSDITPRVGVELSGFGPFINRHSIGVRDRLWAKAMAVEHNGSVLVLVSCDLVGFGSAVTAEVRRLTAEATGLAPECVMVHCTHTHSGPGTMFIGWGEADPLYMKILPRRIAQACIEAVGKIQDATIRHAEVPCEGIGQNREYDRDALPIDEVLAADWRPLKPELTDTTCHVLTFESGGKVIGFASYFGCHPVVCCQQTRYIHGDFVGVASNLVEADNPGSVGLFLQGAQGDVNSCVVHKPEADSLKALDVIAGRYASSLRAGLGKGDVLEIDSLRQVTRKLSFTRKNWSKEKLAQLLAEQEAIIAKAKDDEDVDARMAMVRLEGLRRVMERAKHGPLDWPTELQGFRVGPLLLLGTPFEVFQAIKNDVRARTSEWSWVLAFCNDYHGYAVDHTAAARGGYAADMVPFIFGELPYANVHNELVEALTGLAAELTKENA